MPALPDFLKKIPELTLGKSKERILAIYAAGLVFILIGYFGFFLKPGLTKLFRLLPEIRKGRQEIEEIGNDLAFEDKFNTRLQSLQVKLEEYEKRLSREKEIPMLLENLSEIAKSSHVKILSITPRTKGWKRKESGEAEGVYQEVPIMISAQSGYHELGTFINRLENDKRYMQVSNLRIRTNTNNPKRHSVEFVVYAYTFKKE